MCYRIGFVDHILKIAPFWQIKTLRAQPGQQHVEQRRASLEKCLKVIASPAFGDGSHPTTRLCLQVLSSINPLDSKFRALDFGSGNGILSLAIARMGGQAAGVEIDPNAMRVSQINVELNQVRSQVRLSESLSSVELASQDLVMANILRPILIEYSEELCSRCKPGGAVLLSGLVATDIPEITVRFNNLLHRTDATVYRLEEWRAVYWPSLAL